MATHEAVLDLTVSENTVPRGRTAFGLAIFLSAFLLFQVQLIVAKQLLPWFGGTAGVWSTCLVFFQVLLLVGYAYTHVVVRRLSRSSLVRTHMMLLVGSLMLLVVFACIWRSPIYPSDNLRPETVTSPVWHIVVLLSVSVGFPFLLLSTTGPLLQAWFAHTYRGVSPYRLYALSNLGSLLGLLTYPLVFEPTLTLRNQGRVWSAAYLLYVLACALSALQFSRTKEPYEAEVSTSNTVVEPGPTLNVRLLWLGLAACGSVLLLSVTNLICQEVAVVPFLWVVPLAIYLLTFILCFHDKSPYRRGLFHAAFAATAVWAGIEFLSGERVKVVAQIGWFSLLLFVACMVFHGELVKLKPSPRHLTSFYLYVAGGGALGTVLVGLFAPHVFPAVWEFQLGLWISGFIVAIVLWQDRDSWLHAHRRWFTSVVLLGILAIADYIGVAVTIFHTNPRYLHILVVAAMAATLISVATGPRTLTRQPRFLQVVILIGWCLFGGLFWIQAHRQMKHSVLMARNFYGVLRIEYDEPIQFRHALLEKHGLTLHGAQLQAAGVRATPTLYYGPSSGIGFLLRHRESLTESSGPGFEIGTAKPPIRVGVIGLGIGTLAAYGQNGDYMRFYEMNPEVARLAKGEEAAFTFLHDTSAQTDVVLGDGRISLERELAAGKAQRFDVLAIDAFSSDSIPVHLLTREAMAIYLAHLRSPRSVLAFHISNRALDLGPVLVGLAQQYHLHIARVLTLRPTGDAETPSDWILMAADPTALNTPEILQHSKPMQPNGSATLWTDDYSNLLQVLR